MNVFVVETFVLCNTDKCIENFCEKFSKCRACIFKSVLKRYYTNTDEFLQKFRDKCARFENLNNRIKALEEKFSIFNLTN